MTLVRWMLTWVAALFAVCALGVGALIYADELGAGRGSLPANIIIYVGVILLLGVLLLARGKRR
jgi:hypothetical protein